MNKCPKVLVISHTVFSSNGNMGKTMMDMLSCVPKEKIAQLYFHSEVPTQLNCEKYFRITDKDMLYSVFTRKARFKIFEKEDIETDRVNSRTDSGISAKVYQFSRKRTPMIYILRNIMWSLGKWYTNELDEWIKKFNPEVVFFAAGDYSFSYKLVYKISEKYQIPVVIYCADDHFIRQKKSGNLLYNYVNNNRVKWANRVVSKSCHMITISDKMERDYGTMFGLPITTIRISAQENHYRLSFSKRKGIVYSGNLGVNRITPLLEISRALKNASISGYEYIDVYSGEKNPQTLELLTLDNGIYFHGAVRKEKLEEVLGSAKFVLHTEAFDEISKVRTRYSLSTKVAEYLQSGACVLAYGPRDISSIEYLAENNAAVILNKAIDVTEKISNITNNCEMYEKIQSKAYELVSKRHNKQENDKKIREILFESGKKEEDNEK